MAETLFANMPNGGTVILGVDEANGRFDVVGVKDIATTEAGIATQARDAVQASPHLDFQTFTIDGRQVEVLHVDEKIDYDLAAARGRVVDDLEPELVESYLTTVRTSDRRLRDHADERILRMTNMLTASGRTNVGRTVCPG